MSRAHRLHVVALLSFSFFAAASARAAVAAPTASFKCPANAPPRAAQQAVWSSPLLAKVSPFQVWDCVDGSAVGVLSAYRGRVGDLGWDFVVGGIAERAGGSPQYLFTRGDESPRAIYFALAKKTADSLDLGVTDGSGARYLHESRMLAPEERSARGLVKDAHLVRLRVNEGRGSAPNELHFIASDVEVLDGTKEFPLDVSRSLHEFLEPIESADTKTGKAWRKKLREALVALRAKADANSNANTPAATATNAPKPVELVHAGYRVTWITQGVKEPRLRMTFYAKMAHVLTTETRNPDPHAGQAWCQAPPGADCAPRLIPATITSGQVFTAEYAVDRDVSRTGDVLRTTEHDVETQSAPVGWGKVDPSLLLEAGIPQSKLMP